MIFSVFQIIWVFGYSWSTLLCYWCYYPHRSRDALSPVCGIFLPAEAEVDPGHEDNAGGREVDVEEVVAQGPLHVEGGLKLGDLPTPGEHLAPAPQLAHLDLAVLFCSRL